MAAIVLIFWGEVAAQSPAEKLPELRGHSLSGNVLLFSLTTPSQGGGAKWAALGASVDGFVLESFDAATDTLTVVKEGRRFELPLVESRVRRVPPPANRAEALNYFNSLIDALDAYARRLVTHGPLPPDRSDLLAEKIGSEGVQRMRELTEKAGGKLYVARAIDGLPLVFRQQPFDFSPFPKETLQHLLPEDKDALSRRYIEVSSTLLHLLPRSCGGRKYRAGPCRTR